MDLFRNSFKLAEGGFKRDLKAKWTWWLSAQMGLNIVTVDTHLLCVQFVFLQTQNIQFWDITTTICCVRKLCKEWYYILFGFMSLGASKSNYFKNPFVLSKTAHAGNSKDKIVYNSIKTKFTFAGIPRTVVYTSTGFGQSVYRSSQFWIW